MCVTVCWNARCGMSGLDWAQDLWTRAADSFTLIEANITGRSNLWPSECLPHMKCTPQQCRRIAEANITVNLVCDWVLERQMWCRMSGLDWAPDFFDLWTETSLTLRSRFTSASAPERVGLTNWIQSKTHTWNMGVWIQNYFWNALSSATCCHIYSSFTCICSASTQTSLLYVYTGPSGDLWTPIQGCDHMWRKEQLAQQQQKVVTWCVHHSW